MLGEQPRAARSRGATPAPDGDVALVQAMARGEREALGALYDLHGPVLLGVARKMLGDQTAAEDLVHDVFIEIWQHAVEFDPGRGSVRTWLMVRARSRALDRLGRAARGARALDQVAQDYGGDEEPPTPGIQAAIDAGRVRARLRDLPAELRSVLDCAYFEGLSATECAARLDLPVGTVKSRLARALESLRAALVTPAEGAS